MKTTIKLLLGTIVMSSICSCKKDSPAPKPAATATPQRYIWSGSINYTVDSLTTYYIGYNHVQMYLSTNAILDDSAACVNWTYQHFNADAFPNGYTRDLQEYFIFNSPTDSITYYIKVHEQLNHLDMIVADRWYIKQYTFRNNYTDDTQIYAAILNFNTLP